MAEATTDLKAQGSLAENVRLEFVYPMALSTAQLYGQFDPVSHDWQDGEKLIVLRTRLLTLTSIHLL